MTIGKFVRDCILANPEATNQQLLDKALAQFPQAKTTYACITWYKSDMRKHGILPKRGASPDALAQNIEQLEAQLAMLKAKQAAMERELEAEITMST